MPTVSPKKKKKSWLSNDGFFCRMKTATLVFSHATLFDYLNPWSDLRSVLANRLHIVAMKEGIQVWKARHARAWSSHAIRSLEID